MELKTPQDFLENILLFNPFTAPAGILLELNKQREQQKAVQRKAEQQKAEQQKAEGAAAKPPVSTEAQNLPTQQPVPPGGVTADDLGSFIRAALEAQAAEAKAAREFYPQRAEIDVDVYRRQAEVAQASALERMREKTARDVELQTISAWQGITQAQIQRDTAMGLGMMNLAYQSGMPNTNILNAAAGLAAQGRASFGTPTSVLGS